MKEFECIKTKEYITFRETFEKVGVSDYYNKMHFLEEKLEINIPLGMWDCMIKEIKKELEK